MLTQSFSVKIVGLFLARVSKISAALQASIMLILKSEPSPFSPHEAPTEASTALVSFTAVPDTATRDAVLVSVRSETNIGYRQRV